MLGNQMDNPDYQVGQLIYMHQLFDRNELLIYDEKDLSKSILKEFKTGSVCYNFTEIILPELDIVVKSYDSFCREENYNGKYTFLIIQYKLDFVYEIGDTA